MIEKFSEEELKQIIKELGISSETLIKKSSIQKNNVMCEEKARLIQELGRKPIDAHKHIMKVIDYALNNIDYSSYCKKYRTNTTIKAKDIAEYKEMYNEIYQIVKKHNRKWEDGDDYS